MIATNNQIEIEAQQALQTSMLQRVPDIAVEFVKQGMEPTAAIAAAIKEARRIEDELVIQWTDAGKAWRDEERYVYGEQADKVRYLDGMCKRVYARLRAE